MSNKVGEIEETVNNLLNGQYNLKSFNAFNFTKSQLIGILLGILCDLDIVQKSQYSKTNVIRFLNAISESYFDIPYHSFYHCVDVTFFLYHSLKELSARGLKWLRPVDLAAIGHDLLHPGKNNLFEIQTKSPAAIKFNNQSVLENQSIDHLKYLIDCNHLLDDLVFSEKNTTHVEIFYSTLSSSILSTDMRFHFQLTESLNQLVNSIFSESTIIFTKDSKKNQANVDGLPVNITSRNQNQPKQCTEASKLNNFFSDTEDQSSSVENSGSSNIDLSEKMIRLNLIKNESILNSQSASSNTSMSFEEFPVLNDDQRLLIIHALVHAADISNPLRRFDICQLWSGKVIEEFWAQGDEERQLQFPSLTPNMDRLISNPHQLTIDFIDFVVKPFFKIYTEIFPNFTELLDTLLVNRGKVRVLVHSYTSDKRNSAPVSFNNDKGLRRLSLAAGTIEIPYTIPHTIRRKSKVPSKLKRKVEPRSPIQFPESFNSLILNSSHESSVSFSQYWNTLYAVETAIEPPANASDEELYHQAPNKLFTIDHKTRKSMDEIDRK